MFGFVKWVFILAMMFFSCNLAGAALLNATLPSAAPLSAASLSGAPFSIALLSATPSSVALLGTALLIAAPFSASVLSKVSLSNQYCRVRPQIVNVNSTEPAFSF